MARTHSARLLVLSLLFGGAAACNDPKGGGPTSDFPFVDPGNFAMGGDGGALSDAGAPPAAQDGGVGPAFGAEGGSPPFEGADSDAGAASDGGVDGSSCSELDAGDAASSTPADAQSDAAPDPCEGSEGGTSADGQTGS